MTDKDKCPTCLDKKVVYDIKDLKTPIPCPDCQPEQPASEIEKNKKYALCQNCGALQTYNNLKYTCMKCNSTDVKDVCLELEYIKLQSQLAKSKDEIIAQDKLIKSNYEQLDEANRKLVYVRETRDKWFNVFLGKSDGNKLQNEEIKQLKAEIENKQKTIDSLLNRPASKKCPKCDTIIKTV